MLQQLSKNSSTTLPVQKKRESRPAYVFLDDQEGQRLALAMDTEGVAVLGRWCKAWEAQIHGGSCAAASAMGALRFLGLESNWSQKKIWDEILSPHRLVTAGVSLDNGTAMLRLLGGQALEIKRVCNRNEAELERELRADLAIAFSAGSQLCIIANYLRTLCPPGFSGGGHWSPLGGFAEDRVLILDTHNKLHPPHWVFFADLVRSICEQNRATGMPRGYVTLRKRGDEVLAI
eukprot:TRINITY_DN77888_c0_g1_i1.p1 TRINITY_DN77888_c0_g1~~TRINITY_DN77888_c0_g1_i1.p1  ORF type:complete len:233 (+),score=36.33 TRINITY_DN77888_c0_g1_i1:179-877(+)